ncbi:MAG: tetratricopeptide repeat protein [Caldilineaceae bacterium]
MLESSAAVQHHPKSQIGNLQLKDGLFFVPLQSVTTPSGVIPAIADAVGFQFYNGGSPQQQMLDFLQEKELLLILDNFEHLLGAVEVVATLLAGTVGVKLLVTSREALKLHEEWFHPLAGMRLPPVLLPSATEQGQTSLADYDAIQLFIQTARRALVHFQPEAYQAQIVRICRTVDGLPLAVELAASWLKVLSCSQIADEIEHGLDLLVARHQNVAERHRSMRVVMEQSWALLDAEAQAVLQTLSLFPGGFAQVAAHVVAGADLLTLLDLVDKAWIYRLPEERYQMHELLRHFVAAQWAVDPAAEAAARQRHSRYYLNFLMGREQTLVGKGQQQALEEVAAELENIQAGWRWTVQQQDWATIGRATEALFWFYLMRRRSSEGQEIFTQTVVHLEQNSALARDPELALLRAMLLRKAGVFDFFLGDYAAARAKLEESLAVARRFDRPQEVAYALNVLGVLLGWQGEQAVGIAQLRECLALAQELQDWQTAADAFHELGQLLAHAGDFGEAKTLTLQGLALCRQLERPDWTAHALDTLGWATFCLGEYEESTRYYAESLSIFETLDHKLGTSLALGGLGLVAWAQGGDQLPVARRLTDQSLAICRTIGNRLHCANHLADLAQMASELGDYKQALAYGREGVAIARAVGSPVFEAYNLCSLGSAAYRLGDLTTAHTYLLTAMQTALAAHLLPALVVALFHYAVLLSREGDDPGADAPVPQAKYQRALSLLAGVIIHPACWQIYRQRATTLHATLAGLLAPDVVAVADTYGQARTVEDLATAMLAEMPADTTLLEKLFDNSARLGYNS